MRTSRLADPVSRLLALFVLVGVLTAVALLLTLISYGSAVSQERVALHKANTEIRLQAADAALGRASSSLEGYAADRDPADIRAFDANVHDYATQIDGARANP